MLPSAIPVIRGADIIAQTQIQITPDQPLDYHWEGHGFKVYIPAGAVTRPTILCIQASLSGEYKLPDDGVLVSGVYWLSLYPHVKSFKKKATLGLQHSASYHSDDSALTFITAKCTQETLPYTFEPIPGGIFSKSAYGSIEVGHFVATLAKRNSISDYAFCMYYISKGQHVYEAHITVTPHLDLHLRVRNLV